MYVMKGRPSVEVLLTSKSLLYTLTQMQDKAVADPPATVEVKPGYTTACVLLKEKGTRTSLWVVTGAGAASEWENILFCHHFIGVEVQALFKTFLNLSILYFHLKWLIMVM